MKIKLNQPTVYQCEGVRLMPGENEVNADSLKRLKANKMVAADFKSGLLEEVKGSSAKAEEPKAKAEESKAENKDA